jgi:hypothetical protein
MKKISTSIFVFLMWSFFVYCCLSFYTLEINFKLWSENVRTIQTLFGFVMGAALALIAHDTHEEED